MIFSKKTKGESINTPTTQGNSTIPPKSSSSSYQQITFQGNDFKISNNPRTRLMQVADILTTSEHKNNPATNTLQERLDDIENSDDLYQTVRKYKRKQDITSQDVRLFLRDTLEESRRLHIGKTSELYKLQEATQDKLNQIQSTGIRLEQRIQDYTQQGKEVPEPLLEGKDRAQRQINTLIKTLVQFTEHITRLNAAYKVCEQKITVLSDTERDLELLQELKESEDIVSQLKLKADQEIQVSFLQIKADILRLDRVLYQAVDLRIRDRLANTLLSSDSSVETLEQVIHHVIEETQPLFDV